MLAARHHEPAHQAFPLETINGVAVDTHKVFNGSSRSWTEVDRSFSGGRAADLAVSTSTADLVYCVFLFSFHLRP
jgi:hypothetical protein